MADQISELEKKAKNYLAKKVRYEKFVFSGYGINERADLEIGYYADYLQEDIDHLTQSFIDIYNTEFKKDKEAKSLNDIDIELYKFKGYNSEIDELLDECSEHNIMLEEIDPTPRYLYGMTCYFWNPMDQKVLSHPFEVELSDEDYLYLLTKQLESNNGGPSFSYNTLLEEQSHIAHSIKFSAEHSLFEDFYFPNMPYFIVFDEIIDDAKAIMKSEK